MTIRKSFEYGVAGFSITYNTEYDQSKLTKEVFQVFGLGDGLKDRATYELGKTEQSRDQKTEFERRFCFATV